jgi:hypothetical protein
MAISSVANGGRSTGIQRNTPAIKQIFHKSERARLTGSGRSPDWIKMKNPDAPAVKREA